MFTPLDKRNRQTERQTDGQTNIHTDRQTDKLAEKQTVCNKKKVNEEIGEKNRKN